LKNDTRPVYQNADRLLPSEKGSLELIEFIRVAVIWNLKFEIYFLRSGGSSNLSVSYPKTPL
jgi:hypothetical protein